MAHRNYTLLALLLSGLCLIGCDTVESEPGRTAVLTVMSCPCEDFEETTLVKRVSLDASQAFPLDEASKQTLSFDGDVIYLESEPYVPEEQSRFAVANVLMSSSGEAKLLGHSFRVKRSGHSGSILSDFQGSIYSFTLEGLYGGNEQLRSVPYEVALVHRITRLDSVTVQTGTLQFRPATHRVEAAQMQHLSPADFAAAQTSIRVMITAEGLDPEVRPVVARWWAPGGFPGSWNFTMPPLKEGSSTEFEPLWLHGEAPEVYFFLVRL